MVQRNGTAVFIVNQTPTDPAGLLGIVKSCISRLVKPVVVLIHDRTFLKLYPEQLEIERDASEFKETVRMLKQEGASVFILSKKDIPAHVIDASVEVQGRNRFEGAAARL